MRRGCTLALLAVLMVSAMLTGCGEEPPTLVPYVPSPIPSVTTSPSPVPTPTEDLVKAGMIKTRDAVLGFLRLHEPFAALPERLSWSHLVSTSEGPTGSHRGTFTSGAWVVTLERPMEPDAGYQVTVTNQESQFEWRGVVNSEGEVGPGESAIPREVVSALSRVLEYLMRDRGVVLPAIDSWIGENTTPKGLLGNTTYQFIHADWVITVQYPVVPRPTYAGRVWNTTTGYDWTGNAVSSGPVYETLADAVEAWEGDLVPLCRMAQFDDFFEREDGERYGVEGADAAIQADIAEAVCERASVRIWGEVALAAIDAGGRQIVVSRLEVMESPSVPPLQKVTEGPVERWSGTIRPECWSAEFDDYFERDDGQRFGVEPEGDEVAEAMVAAACDELPVLLWGNMVLEKDYNGRRIVVTRIEWAR